MVRTTAFDSVSSRSTRDGAANLTEVQMTRTVLFKLGVVYSDDTIIPMQEVLKERTTLDVLYKFDQCRHLGAISVEQEGDEIVTYDDFTIWDDQCFSIGFRSSSCILEGNTWSHGQVELLSIGVIPKKDMPVPK